VDPETLYEGTTWYQCDFNIDGSFSPTEEWLNVKVVNPDQGQWIWSNGIKINPKPIFDSVEYEGSLTSVGQGAAGSTITIRGEYNMC